MTDLLEHPANAALVARLRAQATQLTDGTFEDHTHPDLGEWLAELSEGLDTRSEWLFGVPVLATRGGVIFAYALSLGTVVYREPPGGFGRDLPPPRWPADVLPGWVAMRPYLGSRMDWTVREGDAVERALCRAAAMAADTPDAG